MSLPISAVQYTTAKLASTVGMFLIPWLHAGGLRRCCSSKCAA